MFPPHPRALHPSAKAPQTPAIPSPTSRPVFPISRNSLTWLLIAAFKCGCGCQVATVVLTRISITRQASGSAKL